MSWSRREVIRSSVALGFLAGLGCLRPLSAAATTLKMPIGVGLNTNGGPLVMQMQREGLIEAAAKAVGLDVQPEFQDFQALLRMLQGIAAGQLQYGMLGSTPNIRLLATPEPAIPIALAGGGADFPLQVNAGSPIHDLDGLKGKTVLTLVGSDLHLTFINMLRAYFGNENVKELGITVKNVTAVTELYAQQAGIDAYVGVDPGSYGAQERKVLSTLLHNNGTTGPAWDGRDGKGAGITPGFFKKSQYAPEAFYPHRIWWVVRERFMKEQPDAVVSFLVANHRATVALAKAPPERVIELIGDHWASSASLDAKKSLLADTLWRRRGWSWITEGDAKTLVGLSKVKTIFEQELTPALIKSVFAKGSEITRKAYERVGKEPAVAVLVDAGAADVRGRPQWEIDTWSLS
jgi:ABC-type nitrate/sulfonate/bicarbonate transport system substrate-binding protein